MSNDRVEVSMNEVRLGGVIFAQQDETGNQLVIHCENLGFVYLLPFFVFAIVALYKKNKRED